MSTIDSSFDIGDAMDLPSSPISPPAKLTFFNENKHPHSPTDEEATDNDGNSDNVIDPALRNQGPAGPLAGAGSQNLMVFAKRYATKRKLNPQHATEVDAFVTVS